MNRQEKLARELFFGAIIQKRDLQEAREAVLWAKERFGRIPLFERHGGVISIHSRQQQVSANESLLGRPQYERAFSSKAFRVEKLPEGVLARIPFPAAQQADRVNRNNRIYTFDHLKAAVLKGEESASKRAKEGQLYLGGGHAGACEIHKMDDCAGLINEVDFDDATGEVKIVVDLLDLPQGEAAFKILCAGGALPISSVAYCDGVDWVTGYEGQFGTIGTIYDIPSDAPDDAPMYCLLSGIYIEGWDCVLGTQGVKSALVTRRDAPSISVSSGAEKTERAKEPSPKAIEIHSGRINNMNPEERIKLLEAQLKVEAERAERFLADLKRSQEDAERLKADVSELRKVDVEKHRLDTRLASMTERIEQADTLKDEYTTLKAENAKLKNSVQEFDTLKAENATIKAENADLKKRLSVHDEAFMSDEARDNKRQKLEIEAERAALSVERAFSTLKALLKDSRFGDLNVHLPNLPTVRSEEEAKAEFARLEGLVSAFNASKREGMIGTPKTNSKSGPSESGSASANIPDFSL